jgi:hypothetical protein
MMSQGSAHTTLLLSALQLRHPKNETTGRQKKAAAFIALRMK